MSDKTLLDTYLGTLNLKSEHTIRTYKQKLNYFSEWLQGSGSSLSEYKKIEVEEFLGNHLKASKNSSQKTRLVYWNAIKSFSIWLDKREIHKWDYPSTLGTGEKGKTKTDGDVSEINQKCIDDFVTNSRRLSPGASQTYRDCLVVFSKWLEDDVTLKKLSRSTVQQFLDHMKIKRKLSPSTLNKYVAALRKYCEWSKQPTAIEDLRVPKQKDLKNEAPDSLSRTESNKLIRDVEDSGNLQHLAIVETLLKTGVRIQELVNIEITHIQMSDRSGSLSVVGKGNKEREIPLHPEVRRALKKYLDSRIDDIPYLFVSSQRKQLSKSQAQKIVGKYGYNPHKLRHTFAYEYLKSGGTLINLQRILGHSSPETTERYAKQTFADKQREVDTMWN